MKSLNELPTLAEIRDIDRFNPELALLLSDSKIAGEPETIESPGAPEKTEVSAD